LITPSAWDISGKHQAKYVPPKPSRLMADVDASLEQKNPKVAKRMREPNIHHDGQTDDRGATLEGAKAEVFYHSQNLSGARPASTDFALTVPTCLVIRRRDPLSCVFHK
jgi:hypothetical protein